MTETELRKLPNVGPAVARMLIRIGVESPGDLRGKDADALYATLCEMDQVRHDPCVLDTLTAAVDFANGAPARPWWYYSRLRKAGSVTLTGGNVEGSNRGSQAKRYRNRSD